MSRVGPKKDEEIQDKRTKQVDGKLKWKNRQRGCHKLITQEVNR